MSTTISFVAENSFSKAIEQVISKTGLYQSKSEFLRDAARDKLVELMGIEKDLYDVRQSFRKIGSKAVFKGKLTTKQKDEIAKSLL